MADSDLQIREGGGHPEPKMKGLRSPQIFFSAIRVSVWFKNNAVPYPGSTNSSGGEYQTALIKPPHG